MRTLLLCLLLVCSVIGHSQSYSVLYQKAIGCGSADFFYDFIKDSINTYVGAGVTYSSCALIDTGVRQRMDGWVIKLDSSGNKIWSTVMGDTLDDEIFKVIRTSDGGYLTIGYSQSSQIDGSISKGTYDYWITKLDGHGKVSWQKLFGGSGADQAYDGVETDDGAYLIVGLTTSTDGDITTRPGGPSDAWVIKIDYGGNLIWQKAYGSNQSDLAWGISQTFDQHYVIVGRASAGNADVPLIRGRDDVWVMKINATGHLQWSRAYGGTGSDIGYVIQPTKDSGYLIGAGSNSNDFDVSSNYGNTDFWVIKTDGSGALQWEKNYGGSGNDLRITSIMENTDGTLVILGPSTSNDIDARGNHGSTSTSDVLVIKTGNNGDLIWSHMYGGSSGEAQPKGIRLTDTSVVIGCLTNSNNGDITGSAGSADGWFAYLGPKRNVVNPNTVSTGSAYPSIEVFPNPATDHLTIIRGTGSLGVISNILGQELIRVEIKKDNQLIQTGHLPSGIYLLRMYNTEGLQVAHRFMKH